MDENTLKKLLYSLDVGLIEQLPDGLFEVVGYPPEWFRHLFPEGVLENKKFAFNDRTSFLGNFIFDAEKFWDSKQPEQVLGRKVKLCWKPGQAISMVESC